jgi:hypothetical protein
LDTFNFSTLEEVNLLKIFFSSTGSTGLLLDSFTGLNKKNNFVFLPSLEQKLEVGYTKYLLLEVNIAFELPIINITLTRSLANKNILIVS